MEEASIKQFGILFGIFFYKPSSMIDRSYFFISFFTFLLIYYTIKKSHLSYTWKLFITLIIIVS